MEKCRPHTLLDSYKFDYCEFWVQIHNIALDILKEDVVCITKDLRTIVVFNRQDVEKWTNYA